MSSPPRIAALAVLLVGPAAVWGALTLGFDPVGAEARRPLIHRDGGYVGSGSCRGCHEDHHASWHRTFHRTMTQRATEESVVGEFDGRPVRWLGKEARPFGREGRHLMELPADAGGTRTAEVVMTVGSRRYQQYFERLARPEGFALVRLPLLWHIEERRWMHVNSVFLGPDDPDWGSHASEWNENCVFCHNTAPEPRMLNHDDPARTSAEWFDTKVGELGIACESCHGPGAGHVSQEREPLGRYRRRLLGGPAPAIVHPGRLEPARSVAVCGQCHGARLPDPPRRVKEWLTTGPTYRPGDDLADHVRLIHRDTPVEGAAPDLFRLRFWGDGTPRLTAYEMQGLTLSACHLRGGATCVSCHAMHDGDPRGQIRPDRAGDAMCLSCHAAIGRDVRAHTHHDPAGSGAACAGCHMPRIVYGITALHRSHRIDAPDAARDAEAGRPGACTLCHLDRSPLWAADETARLWGRAPRRPARRADGAPLDLPDSLASIYAGDAVQRVAFATAMGARDAERGALSLRTHLAFAFGDGYPSVRRAAARSFAALGGSCREDAEVAALDPLAGEEEARRRLVATALRAARTCEPSAGDPLISGSGEPRIDAIRALLDLQDGHVIAIGE